MNNKKEEPKTLQDAVMEEAQRRLKELEEMRIPAWRIFKRIRRNNLIQSQEQWLGLLRRDPLHGFKENLYDPEKHEALIMKSASHETACNSPEYDY